MTVQYIGKNGQREYAVVPIDEYERLVAAAAMADDILAYDNAKSEVRIGDETTVPSQVVNRLVDGDNPMRVWREFRGLTPQQLAKCIGITESYLQQLESGIKQAGVRTLSRMASALHVVIDDITCWLAENQPVITASQPKSDLM